VLAFFFIIFFVSNVSQQKITDEKKNLLKLKCVYKQKRRWNENHTRSFFFLLGWMYDGCLQGGQRRKEREFKRKEKHPPQTKKIGGTLCMPVCMCKKFPEASLL